MAPEGQIIRGERGWALVSVLWVLSMLALLAAATQTLTITSATSERHALQRTRIDALLDGGVARAIVGITDRRIASRWPIDGEPRSFPFEGEVLRVSVQDEFGKIDLNAADGSLLRQLMVSAGLAPDDAAALVDKILDWRGASDLKRLNGATDADYAAAGLKYRPRHGPFQTVDELQLVLGMTTALFDKIRPALTVYSKHPAIDTNTAPKEALLAYYPNQPDKVGALLKLRGHGSEALNSNPGVLDATLPLSGRTFSISVTLSRAKLHFQRFVVVELTNNPARPYLVFCWR